MNHAQRFMNLVSVLDSTEEAAQLFGDTIVNTFPLGEATAWLFDDTSIAYIHPTRRDTFESVLALQQAVDLSSSALASSIWR